MSAVASVPDMTTSTVPLRPQGRVHIIGAGPVGLFLAALLQGVEGQRVRLYERRSEYTRTRMVSLAKYLVADSIESYKEDEIDGQDVEALFDPVELQTRLAYRRPSRPDLRALLEEWARGFVPLNVVENRLSELIESRDTGHGRARLGDRRARRGSGEAGARRHGGRLHRHARPDARPAAPRGGPRRPRPQHAESSISSTPW